MSLNPEQVKIIKSTVPVLQEHGNHITYCFYQNMLREVPELNNVFNCTNQINGRQAAALAGSLYAYANHVDDLGALSPAVERICQKVISTVSQCLFCRLIMISARFTLCPTRAVQCSGDLSPTSHKAGPRGCSHSSSTRCMDRSLSAAGKLDDRT